MIAGSIVGDTARAMVGNHDGGYLALSGVTFIEGYDDCVVP